MNEDFPSKQTKVQTLAKTTCFTSLPFHFRFFPGLAQTLFSHLSPSHSTSYARVSEQHPARWKHVAPCIFYHNDELLCDLTKGLQLISVNKSVTCLYILFYKYKSVIFKSISSEHNNKVFTISWSYNSKTLNWKKNKTCKNLSKVSVF